MKYPIHILTLLLTLSVGCASYDSQGLANDGIEPSRDERLGAAQDALERNEIDVANGIFKSELTRSPTDGEAAAGLAVTDLLLMPYHPTVTTLITENLGGSGGLNQNRDIIYGDQGFLFFLAKGVPWEDDGMFAGLRSILENDLPWQGERIESFEAFVDPLTNSVNDLMKNLVAIADAFAPIQANIEIALADDTYRDTFLPGQVFHHESLTLNITKPDLAILNAGISAVRGFVYFTSAYEFDFSLSEAFGQHWYEIGPNDAEFIETYEASDYIVEFLDPKMFRTIRDGDRLKASGDVIKSALSNIRRALQLSQETPTVGTLMWGEADPTSVEIAINFLEAIESSVDGSTMLPGFEPTLALDLSDLFADGRVLDAALQWMERFEVTDDVGTYYEWELTQAAYDAFFGGLFTPPLDGAEFEWADGDDVGELIERVFNPFADDVEDVYLQTL